MENKERQYYIANNKKRELQQEIEKLGFQLTNVEKKLASLETDLKFYIAFCAVPIFLLLLSIPFGWVASGSKITDQIIGRLFTGLLSLAASFYMVLLFPVMLVKLLQTLYLLKQNLDTEALVWTKPAARPTHIYYRPSYHTENSPSYIVEKKKVVWVLNKYYLSLETIESLLAEIEQGRYEDQDDLFEEKLSEIVFYEEIPPATPFGKVQKQATAFSILLLLSLIALMLFLTRIL